MGNLYGDWLRQFPFTKWVRLKGRHQFKRILASFGSLRRWQIVYRGLRVMGQAQYICRRRQDRSAFDTLSNERRAISALGDLNTYGA
jgi:hypothetical protein